MVEGEPAPAEKRLEDLFGSLLVSGRLHVSRQPARQMFAFRLLRNSRPNVSRTPGDDLFCLVLGSRPKRGRGPRRLAETDRMESGRETLNPASLQESAAGLWLPCRPQDLSMASAGNLRARMPTASALSKPSPESIQYPAGESHTRQPPSARHFMTRAGPDPLASPPTTPTPCRKRNPHHYPPPIGPPSFLGRPESVHSPPAFGSPCSC